MMRISPVGLPTISFRNIGPAIVALGLTAGAFPLELAYATEITQCSQMCGSNTTCIVSQRVDVKPGAVLDCSGRDISLVDPSGNIVVTNGSFALIARHLSISHGHEIRATENATKNTGIDIDLTGTLTLTGQLKALNAGGSSHVYVRVQGSISMNQDNPAIDTSGTANGCDGGSILVTSKGNITINADVDASGHDGGDATNINSGGDITISSAANVVINDELRAFGRLYEGGVVEVTAGGSISMYNRAGTNEPKGQINVEGRQIDGYGGVVSLVANNSVTVSGPIYAASGVNATGGYGLGGALEVSAGCGGVFMDSLLDVTGGEDGGGDLDIVSDGPVTLAGTVNAYSRRFGGPGGIVSVTSGKSVTLDKAATINVNGHDTSVTGEDGDGGILIVQACQVDVGDDYAVGAQLTALGAAGGAILLEGSKTLTSGTDFSIRVGDKASLDVTGSATPGSLDLNVKQRRLGYCSNNANATCQQNSECFFGCGTGTCNYGNVPNPDTQGFLSQFHPTTATMTQKSDLIPCTTVCP